MWQGNHAYACHKEEIPSADTQHGAGRHNHLVEYSNPPLQDGRDPGLLGALDGITKEQFFAQMQNGEGPFATQKCTNEPLWFMQLVN